MTDTNTVHGGAVDLLPCPFCGDGDPEITGEYGWVWVACTTGSDCAGRGPDSDDDASAIAAWNRRRPTPQADTDAREKVVEALQGAIEWDKERGYRMPYRVRDPLYEALAALKTGDA